LRKNSISLCIGVLLLALWYHFFMDADTLKHLLQMRIGWLALAGVFFFTAFAVRAFRWSLIMHPIKVIPYLKLLRIYLAGTWVNYLVPLKVVGEVFKSYQLKKTENLPMSLTLPTVFVEKFYAFSVMIASLALLPLFSFRLHKIIAGALSAVGVIYLLMLVFIFGLIHKKEQLEKAINLLFFFLRVGTREKALSLAGSFLEGLALVKREGLAILSLTAASFLVLVFDALNFYAFFRAVNLPLPFLTCYFGSCMLSLFYFLPAPPASIGSNELYGPLIFVFGFGCDTELTPLAILSGHAINALVVALSGTLALISVGGKVADYEQATLEVS